MADVTFAAYPHLHMPVSPPHILLIDDDELSRAVLELHLTEAGYLVTTAESGDDALTQLRAGSILQPIDAVLTDLQMPGTCGPPLALELRPLLPPTTRILVMSGSQPSPDRTLNYDAFLLKPLTPQQLTTLLHPQAAAEPSAAVQGTPILDDITFQQLTGMLNPAQQIELLTLCFTELDHHFARMEAARQSGDRDALCREAHAVKGSFAMIGARELAAAAAALELHCPADAADQAASLSQIGSAASRLAGMLATRGYSLPSVAPAHAAATSPND